MTDYHDMTGRERFAALDTLATAYFGTGRWKTAFGQRYGVTTKTVVAWRHRGAPVWALTAIVDAVEAKHLRLMHKAAG